jgi:flagellar biosynthetic protein FliR
MNPLPNPVQLLGAALAFLRISAILFALPIIGDPPTPIKARLLLGLALTFALYPTLPAAWTPSLDGSVLAVAGIVAREVLIGLVIGYVARLAFDGALAAAGVVAYQMGFGTGHLFLPDVGAQLDSFSALHRQLLMLIFLALGLHAVFFQAIADSFQIIPGGAAGLSATTLNVVLAVSSSVLAIAVQLSAPILVALLFALAALGLVARTVPNMNVFVMSFPISFVTGLVIYIALLPLYPDWLIDHLGATREHLLTVLHGLGSKT